MNPFKGGFFDRLADLELEVARLRSLTGQLPARTGAGAAGRQTRLAVTCPDPSTSLYPEPPANTFWIKLLDGSFTETTGEHTPDTTPRTAQGKFLCHNLTGAFIPNETTIEVTEHNGQFWCEVFRPDQPTIYRLVDCRQGLPGAKPDLYVSNDLEAQVGLVAVVASTCYRIFTAPPGACSSAGCVSIDGFYPNCSYCRACWILHGCVAGDCDDEIEIITNTDLAAFAGQVVALAGEAVDCYCVIGPAPSCAGARPVTVIGPRANCTACGNCFSVYDCEETSAEAFEISNDLTLLPELVGKTPAEIVSEGWVLKAADGKCYRVHAVAACVGSPVELDVASAHPSCSACYAARPCYALVNCDNEADVICTSHAINSDGDPLDLADYLGQVVLLDDLATCKRYTVHLHADIEPECDCAPGTIVTVLEAYSSCAAARLWTLEQCENSAEQITTYTDLSAFALGHVFKDAEGVCWIMIVEDAACDDEAVAFDYVSEHPECANCLGEVQYILTPDCDDECGEGGDPPDPIITNQDLHAAVGQTVKIGGVCYTVEVYDGEDPSTDETVSYTGPYASCEECVAAREPVTLTLPAGCPTLTESGLLFKMAKVTFPAGVTVCPASDCLVAGEECPPEEE